MTLLISLAAGLLFGLGLLLSGMADPAKVLGFLDVAGTWDPSLAFVMAGAIGVGLPVFALARRRTRALDGAPMQLPTATEIDRPLVLGSLAFGAGWGLAGFCPGPALVGLGLGQHGAMLFTAAMVAGMLLFERLPRRSGGAPAPSVARG